MPTRSDFEPATFGTLGYRWRRPFGRGPAGLLVFLHGLGERGTDNERQLSYPFFGAADGLFAPATLNAANCHVVAPQVAESDKWVDVSRFDLPEVKLATQPTEALADVLALIDDFAARHPINKKRIYLAGLSMGAFGVFDALARRPRFFAAAVAVCGAGDLRTVPAFKDTPLFLAHGALDRGVPIKHSRDMAKALTAAGAKPVFRDYADGGHDVWNRAFVDPELGPWLYSRTLV